MTLAEEKKKGNADEGKSGKKDDKKKDAVTRIDFDGLASRVVRVPVPFDNYDSLSAAEGRLLYVRQPLNGFGAAGADAGIGCKSMGLRPTLPRSLSGGPRLRPRALCLRPRALCLRPRPLRLRPSHPRVRPPGPCPCSSLL